MAHLNEDEPMTGQHIDLTLILSPLWNYSDYLPQVGPLDTTYKPIAKDEFLNYNIDNATANPFHATRDLSIAPIPDLPMA